MTLTLRDGTSYAHSFTAEDLVRLEAFVLSHERTLTMSEVAAGDHDPAAICVRHDVDHDAIHAVRFAEREAELGIRASYYLLPSAPYWPFDARECGLRMQELGHEVGLHCNAYTSLNGDQEGALLLLAEQAEAMRSWGIDVRGAADHGAGEPLNVDLWRVHGHHPSEAGLGYEAYELMRGMRAVNYLSDSMGDAKGRLVSSLRDEPGKLTMALVHWCHWPFPG